MKKTVRIAALMLVLVMTVFVLASCGNKPKGEYTAKIEAFGQSVETTYDFGGKDFTCTTKTTVLGTVNTEVTEGTYEIIEAEDGSLEIALTVDDKTSTFTYEKADEYIKIGGVQYNKVK
ncbi:MAG: hypothetical protein IKC16_00045 [Clostridia bacterium]|nr:hypothetical protein [Clostridia bacterium]